MGQLDGKVAIITGGSSGIGRSIALACAAEGAIVVPAARNEEALAVVAAEIEANGGTALAHRTDVTAEEDVVDLFHSVHGKYGRVDILVNNAGVASSTPTDEMSLAEWQRILSVNLNGPFLCSREALKIMKPQRSGRILNIGSISAKMPRANAAPYSTSKFGLEGLTRSLALDARPFGIAVSVLQPGNTASAIWERRGATEPNTEGIMPADELARVALLMVTLPPEINVLESIVLPVSQPFVGRG